MAPLTGRQTTESEMPKKYLPVEPDCNGACNGGPDTPHKPGPRTRKGQARALANLVPGGNMTHGGWRWLRRAELPMPWGGEVAEEITEIQAWLLSKCGGPDEASLSALMRIRRIGQSWGFLACLDHWTANRHGAVQSLTESWTKAGGGLVHSRHGRLPKALSEDGAKFWQRLIDDLEVLESKHFIDTQDTVPLTPEEWVRQRAAQTAIKETET